MCLTLAAPAIAAGCDVCDPDWQVHEDGFAVFEQPVVETAPLVTVQPAESHPVPMVEAPEEPAPVVERPATRAVTVVRVAPIRPVWGHSTRYPI
jgi:hypothetical protein